MTEEDKPKYPLTENGILYDGVKNHYYDTYEELIKELEKEDD